MVRATKTASRSPECVTFVPLRVVELAIFKLVSVKRVKLVEFGQSV